jgi:isopenicillin-N N-acyltransferase like protein
MAPVLFDDASPLARGRAHGELWRSEIRDLAELRTHLCLARGTFADAAQLLSVSRLHLPVLAAHLPELHDELVGIAEGADLAPEHIVVLNHYTDLRDVPPSVLDGSSRPSGPDAEPDGCTALYLHGTEGPVLGQTWDMHASAEPFVRSIRVREADGREAICFTLTGCLGMAGMGAHGVGVTINNLSSTDGGLGVVWPALVRAMIAQRSARAAYELLLRTPLSSGHHYMIADGDEFFGVECSGQLKVLTQVGAKAAHLHTNHCFDPVLRMRENVARASSTFDRLNMATTLYVQQRPTDLDGLWRLLASHDGRPRSICSHLDEERGDASASKTCGRLAMELATGRIRLARGCSDAEQQERPVEVRIDPSV